MKKGDAAAAAELRLAKAAWLPEILTDREMPPIRALGVMNDLDDEADEDEAENPKVASANEANAQAASTAADTAPANEHHPAWPFPTSASIANAEAMQHTA
ncbi:hypothetical protein [Burkholderia sp. AW49-1]